MSNLKVTPTRDAAQGATGRMVRVNRLLQEALAELVPAGLSDPRIQQVNLVSIAEVEASPDLSRARVRVTVYGSEAEQEGVLLALRKASGFLRRELGQRVRLRRIPQLVFLLNDGPKQAARVEQLLQELACERGSEQDRP